MPELALERVRQGLHSAPSLLGFYLMIRYSLSLVSCHAHRTLQPHLAVGLKSCNDGKPVPG